MSESIQLTKEGFQALNAEYKHLQEVEKPEILKVVEEMRILGDLRENEAYHMARHRQALIQGRMEELDHILKRAKIVEPMDNSEPNKVKLGSKVKVLFNEERELAYKIVPEHEADITSAKISELSPLGQMLIGRNMGDVVKVEVPAGTVEYRILGVE
jgi:transcription elongation factor GreA